MIYLSDPIEVLPIKVLSMLKYHKVSSLLLAPVGCRPFLRLLLAVSLLSLIVLPTAILSATSYAQTFSTPTTDTSAPPTAHLKTLSTLVNHANLIVQGAVVDVHSFWTDDHALIESDVTIDVTHALLGASAKRIVVRTEGGFLTAENLGMSSPHAATFQAGENVLLFIKAVDQAIDKAAIENADSGPIYRMVRGAAGKYLLYGDTAWNRDGAAQLSLYTLRHQIVQIAKQKDWQMSLPLNTPSVVDADSPHVVPSMAQHGPPPIWQHMLTQSEQRKWRGPETIVPFTVHTNSKDVGDDSGSAADFRAAILSASNTWSMVANADFSLAYTGPTDAITTSYNRVNEIVFMRKGTHERGAAAQFWYTREGTIIEADIWINDDFRWNARGVPAANEIDLQSAILHELGHWLVLGHVRNANAVMYPKIATGAVRHALHQQDMDRIGAVYPCAQLPCTPGDQ